MVMASASTLQLKSINGLNFLGTKWEEFLSPARASKEKVECWVKVYTSIFYFYMNPKNENKEFFVSNGTILEKLNKGCGNNYHIRTIQKAIRTIEDLKLGTVSFEKEYKDNGKIRGIKRIVKLDMKKAFEIFGCMNFEQPIFKNLNKRERLKKIIRKRPFALTKALESAFDFCKNVAHKSIQSVNELIVSFVHEVSRKYFCVEKMFKDFKPQSVMSDQEKIDSFYYKEDTGEIVNYITEDEVEYLEKNYHYKSFNSSKIARYKERFTKALKKIIGERCNNPVLRARLENMNIGFDGNIINNSRGLSSDYDDNGGFEML